MNRLPHHSVLAVALILLVATSACDDAPDEPAADDQTQQAATEQADADEPDEPVDDSAHDMEDDPRLDTAKAADKKLRQTLMGRVQEVMGSDGPVAAVDVCHEEAIPLTEDIAEEFGVAIGRVSDQRRNPDNTGEDWVWNLIDDAQGEAHQRANDTFQRVTPIELADGCATCHGQQEDIPPEVAEVIDARYPDDQATGYEPGDLRGWVWVEVP